MARREPDHYSKRARQEGYSARSVYKLQELQQRFRILRSGVRVLDVGAAPGSWTQYMSKLVGPDGHVVAVDLSPLDDLEGIPGVTPIVGDVFSPEVIAAVSALGPFAVVVSDAAPKTSGNRVVDTTRSAALVEQVIDLCDQLLAPGGNMVAKVFQGGDEHQLLQSIRERFATARLIKPKASRSESFETFLVGLDKR
ncbi:MAG: RlmE family RNA methyltransferase [Spirochaetales bacterium]|nr:MAG: RlmE family RNA methyltransferase [Spirochaetales bacterium]